MFRNVKEDFSAFAGRQVAPLLLESEMRFFHREVDFSDAGGIHFGDDLVVRRIHQAQSLFGSGLLESSINEGTGWKFGHSDW